MFDLNPLHKPDAMWQLWLLAIVAGGIGFMIAYATRRKQIMILENELVALEFEVDTHLAQPIPNQFSFVKPLSPETPVSSVRAVKAEDLKIIEGVGPKIEALLNEAGVVNFSQLAASSPEYLRQILDAAGPRFQMHDPTSWPQQARLASKGQWDELKQLQQQLIAGRA